MKVVIAQAVGEYILKQECPVIGGSLVPVVLQHDRLQATLAHLLDKIGLEWSSPCSVDG